MPTSSEIVTGSPAILQLPVQKIAAGRLLQTTDPVAVEQPLEIRIRYGPAARQQEQSLSITMRTPGNDEELALGWLYTEGILPDGIPVTTNATGDTITITLPESLAPDLSRSQRHSYTSSSCGVCGKTSLQNLRVSTPQHPGIGLSASDNPGAESTAPNQPSAELSIPATLLCTLPALLREEQDIFEATGGLHAAGLFSAQGRLIALREDIGRHNALDKLIGYALRQNLPLAEAILLLSGRACFELIQKAAIAGIKIVSAVGPPSSMAVSHAEEAGLTLVGFLRNQRFNIYSGAHRIHV